MAIETFNRYENKYMLNGEIFYKIQKKLSDYMKLDKYNEDKKAYTISNLYYDTDDSYLIRTSLSKPKYKEKLRIRAYGTPEINSHVFIEIKKKFEGRVNKRRSTLTLAEAYEFIESGVMPEEQPYQNRQVLREINYMADVNKLKPALYLAYDRLAFFGEDISDLRVSFDKNIRTRRYDLTLEKGDYGKQLINPEQCLMEIKVTHSIPVWLTELLSEYKIYPISFSKYGAEYLQTLENKRVPQIFYTVQNKAFYSESLLKTADLYGKGAV